MIHNFVLFSFVSSTTFILYEYEKYTYVFFILFCTLPLILFKVFFHSKHPIITVIILICFSFLIQNYVQYHIHKQEKVYNSGFIYKDKQNVNLTGHIGSSPAYRYSNNQYVLVLNDTNTKIILYTQPYQKFLYLNEITLQVPVLDVREQGEEWQGYYRKIGVQYVVLYPDISKVTNTAPQDFYSRVLLYVFSFKNFIRYRILTLFSSHTSALVLGMLLGEKDELSKEEKNMFSNSSLSHILVVSGYNISLVISFIFIFLKKFSRYTRIILTFIFIFLFTLLVGFEASIVRASCMAYIVVLTKLLHRDSGGIHILFLTGSLMLLYEPEIIFDAGFHLSFLATYILLNMPKFNKIPEYFLTTFAIFLFLLPYITYLSKSISIVGIFTNTLVLICIPVFMSVSGISLLLSIFNIKILFDIFMVEIIGRYIFFVAQFAQFVPRVQYEISSQFCVVIYVLILSFISFVQNRYTTEEFIERHYQKFVPHKTS